MIKPDDQTWVLISKYASSFSIKGHWLLGYEELMSEGLLVYAELYRNANVWESKKDFVYLFQASLRRRFINLYKQANRTKRKTTFLIEVDLEEALNTVSVGELSEFYVEHKLRHAKELMTPQEYKVFRELVIPSRKTIEIAKRQAEESGHFRLGMLHIYKSLNMSKAHFMRILNEVKDICRTEAFLYG